ncbi:MAG: SsrA-binding protein SmpB [Pirellulaceae bacterium]|nr:SsrA-binding protein SmpB [Pirellulaceae bacterium]
MNNKPKPTHNPSVKAKPKSPATGKAKPAAGGQPIARIVAENRKARHKFEIIDSLECGVMLQGSEVKSLRNGKCQLDEAYGRVKGDTLLLVGCDIAEYPQATLWNHEPKRPRKLLVHKTEFTKFVGRAREKGLTLVPLRMYFNERGIAKCELALCKGRKVHDKREKLKKADAQRDMQRATRRRS